MSTNYPGGVDPYFPIREIIFRAWGDANFKQSLLNDPLGVMKQYGCKIPPNITTIEVLENTDAKAYFVLPKEPPHPGMSDDEIKSKLESMLFTQLVFPTVLD